MFEYFKKFKDAIQGNEEEEDLKSFGITDDILEKLPGISGLVANVKKLQSDVFSIKKRLENTVNGLKADVLQLKNSANNLATSVINAGKNITNAFKTYGISLKDAGIGVSNSAQELAQQMEDAVNEMKPALNQVKTYAYYLRRDWWNIFAVAHNAFQCINYMALSGTGGQGAVLWEALEAFGQISAAFQGFKDNFNVLSNVSKDAPIKLSNIINGEMQKINNALLGWINGFVSLTEHLSINLE